MKNNCVNSIKKYSEIILICIAVVGLWFTYAQLKQNATATKYMYLTGVWNEIMKDSIERPEFNDTSKTLIYNSAFNAEEKQQYESYVRWIGGFIEDLYFNEYQKEKWFFYDPWIDNTLESHQTWFIDHMHYYKHTPNMYRNSIIKYRVPLF